MSTHHPWTWFSVPGLRDDVVVGSTCCAVSGAFLVEQELHGWHGVLSVQVDPSRGLVRIEHTGQLNCRGIAEALRGLGFPVAAWAAPARQEC
jgi:hypothetical protein